MVVGLLINNLNFLIFFLRGNLTTQQSKPASGRLPLTGRTMSGKSTDNSSDASSEHLSDARDNHYNFADANGTSSISESASTLLLLLCIFLPAFHLFSSCTSSSSSSQEDRRELHFGDSHHFTQQELLEREPKETFSFSQVCSNVYAGDGIIGAALVACSVSFLFREQPSSFKIGVGVGACE